MSGGGGGGGGLGAGLSYQKFVHFALEQTRLRTTLTPHPSQVLATLTHLFTFLSLFVLCEHVFLAMKRA